MGGITLYNINERALPTTGSISMKQVNVELKKPETQKISLNDSDVRKLASKANGVISLNDLKGKSNTEYVNGYTLYNNHFSGYRKQFSFSVTIPRNIVSGNINFYSKGTGRTYSSKCIFNGIEHGYGTFNNSFNVAGYSKGKVLYGSGNTGSSGSGRDEENGTVDIKITFTGEWAL